MVSDVQRCPVDPAFARPGDAGSAAPNNLPTLPRPVHLRPAGPSGSSVREIMRVTGADVKSWTENKPGQNIGGGTPPPAPDAPGGGAGTRRPCRVLVVEGEEPQVLHAVNVIVSAVDRYKDLCEGRYQGA